MSTFNHKFKVGDRVSAPDGWNAKNEPNPRRTGVIVELYGPNQWPRVQWDDGSKVFYDTCSPKALKLENETSGDSRHDSAQTTI